MADFWQQWSVNPCENSASPPNGAGEKKMGLDQITDTFRVVMAACAQLGNRILQFKSMATQAHDNVNIIGGSIGSGVSIAAEALKSGLIDLNRIPGTLTGKAADNLTTSFKNILYTWIYPVGRIMLWHSNDLTAASGLIWPGVTAVWEIVPTSGDRLLVSAGSLCGPAAGAGTKSYVDTPTCSVQTANATVQAGTGAGVMTNHAHTISTYDPFRYGFNVIRRVS